jgi:hypothetical protein
MPSYFIIGNRGWPTSSLYLPRKSSRLIDVLPRLERRSSVFGRVRRDGLIELFLPLRRDFHKSAKALYFIADG